MARHARVRVLSASEFMPLPKPQVGMVISVYLDRADVGSGTRQYVITRVGRRYVTLFYIPQLKTVRIKQKDWGTMRAIRTDSPNMEKLAAGVEGQVDKYIRHNMQYSQVEVDRVLAILLGVTRTAA